MRLFKKIIYIFIFLFLFLTTTFIWIVYTQSGLRFTINNIIKYYFPELKIKNISGNLKKINLNSIFYKTKNFHIKIDYMNLSLKLNCLRKLNFCLTDFLVKNIDIKIHENILFFFKKYENFKQINNFIFLNNFFLNNVLLENINIKFSKNNIFLFKLNTKINWNKKILNVQKINIYGLILDLKKKYFIEKFQTIRFIENILKIQKKIFFKKKKIFFSIKKIPKFYLNQTLNLKNFDGKNWFLNNDFKVDRLQFNLILKKNIIIINNLFIDTAKNKLRLTGNMNFNHLNAIYINFKIIFYYNNFSKKKLHFKITGSLLNQINLKLDFIDYFSFNLKTKIIFFNKKKRKQFKYKKNNSFQIKNINDTNEYFLKAIFKINNFNFIVEKDKIKNLFPLLLILNIKYNKGEIKLENSKLEFFLGKIDFYGIINWKRLINWKIFLKFSKINIQEHFFKFYKIYDGKIFINGKIYKNKWKSNIFTFNAFGKLNNNLIKLNIKIIRNLNGLWKIPFLNLLIGSNELNIYGNINKKIKMNILINILEIKKIIPYIDGVIKGKIQLKGKPIFPVLNFVFFIKNIKWKDNYFINKVLIKSKIYFFSKIYWKFDFLIKKVNFKKIFFNLHFLTEGNEKKHIVKIKLSKLDFLIRFLFYGHFNFKKKIWNGVLNKNHLKTKIGNWILNKNINLKYINSEKKIKIESHCWLNSDQKICFDKKNNISKNGEINVFFKKINLKIIKEFLPYKIQSFGYFFGKTKLIWNINNSYLYIKLNLKNKNKKTYQPYNSTESISEFNKIQLKINIKENKIILNWLIQIFDESKIFGSININNFKNKKKIQGNIKIRNFSLNLIEKFFEKKEYISGKLNGNVNLYGTTEKPFLSGTLLFSNMKIYTNYFQNEINKSFIKINFLGEKLSLNGKFHTKNGYLRIYGRGIWKNIKKWKIRLFAIGDKINLFFAPKTNIEIKPNLIFEVTPKFLKINGKILIYSGNIFFQKKPKFGVNISKDEIILDEQNKLFKKNISIPIISNINIEIDPKVYLDLFGLKSKLKGKLKIEKDKDKFNLNGEVDLFEGRFHQFGQDLVLENGQILFFAPTGQPFLNLEVIKNPENTNDNMIAKIKITGLINKPKTTFFSTKIKSKKEEFSYIFKESTSNDINNIDLILLFINIGLIKSEKFIDDFGKMLGVSELILNTNGNGHNSQLILSGKIKKYLQIKYGIGIFNSNTTFGFRYYLLPKLYFESVFGENKIFSLLYQLDF